MQRRSLEIWVGLFVLIGLVALAVLALKVGNLAASTITDGYRVTARFDNIGGLKVKAPVTLAGVVIGRVADITIDREEYIAVTHIDIDKNYDNIPLDSHALILTQGLLGAQYIGVEPGGDETYLSEGDDFMSTQPAIALEQIIGQMLFSQTSGDKADEEVK